MSLQGQLTEQLKMAMKNKDVVALEALRAVKSAMILAKTASGVGELSPEQELQIIQKQVKQRKESATLFTAQNRQDLANPELAQAAVIAQFLPKPLSEKEIEAKVITTINEINASGIKDMGKVMGIVNKALAGRAEGKIIASIVKKNLS